MTIRELYEWACEKGLEDSDIIVNDSTGCLTSYIEPECIHHVCENGDEYNEVIL